MLGPPEGAGAAVWRRQAAVSMVRPWCGGIGLLCPWAGSQSSRGGRGHGVEASDCCVHGLVLNPPKGAGGVGWRLRLLCPWAGAQGRG